MRSHPHFMGVALAALASSALLLTAAMPGSWALLSNAGAGEQKQQQQSSPDATFRTLDGESITLASLSGKPVLLSFWSTSCAICIEEMPKMALLYHTLKQAGAEMISVTMPYDPPNHVVAAVQQHGIPFPVAIDLDGQLMRTFEIPGTPVKILLSPDGVITRQFIGPLDYATTLNAVQALLKPTDADG